MWKSVYDYIVGFFYATPTRNQIDQAFVKKGHAPLSNKSDWCGMQHSDIRDCVNDVITVCSVKIRHNALDGLQSNFTWEQLIIQFYGKWLK